MTPVFQDKFGHGRGNCLQAAIASVIGLPLEDVPDFADGDSQWFLRVYQWCIEKRIGVVYFPDGNLPPIIGNCYGVAGVRVSESSEETHAVVMQYEVVAIAETGEFKWEGRVVHDPNPRRLTITEILDHIIFIS
jgi:hypothetical protein